MGLKSGINAPVVGAIPEPWEVSTVGGEFDIELGKMLDAEKNQGVPKPYIGNMAVQWNRIETTNLPFVPMSKSDLERFRLKKGDLLVCEGGEVGRAAIWDGTLAECYYQKALHRLRPRRGYNPRLMLAFLHHWAAQNLLADYVTQTSIAHLPKERFSIIPLPILKPAEQSRIAGVLADIDVLLVHLEQLLIKKRDLKQAAMQQLLTGKRRLPGFVGPWTTCAVGAGVTLLSGQHVLAKHYNFCGDGVPYLTGPSDFPDGGIRQTKFTRHPTTLCDFGDILVTVKGSGSGSLIVADRIYCISRQLMAIRVNTWSSYFVYYSLLQNSTQIRAASTGLIPGLSRSDIFDQLLPLPPTAAEQVAIADVLSDMDTEIATLEVRREKTRLLKQGMMQQLLTGKIRLS